MPITSFQSRQWADPPAASCRCYIHPPARRCHQIPIAPAAPPVPHFPRLRALALFGRRPPQRVDSLVMPASENLHGRRLSRCSKRNTIFIRPAFDAARHAILIGEEPRMQTILQDRMDIADLMTGWIHRDLAQWDDLRTLFHPDGEIEITWFEGKASDFVDASMRMGASDLRTKHLITSPVVAFNGYKAVVETNVVI